MTGRIRYFKATDGRVTVLRSSSVAVYRSAYIVSVELTRGFEPVRTVFFWPTRPNGEANCHAAVEISAAEYARLMALRVERILRDHGEEMAARFSASRQHSWVRNADIAAEAGAELPL